MTDGNDSCWMSINGGIIRTKGCKAVLKMKTILSGKAWRNIAQRGGNGQYPDYTA